MTSLMMKIVLMPLVIGLSSILLTNVHYSNVIQPITVGIILAIVGTAMEYMALTENTTWLSTLLDFAAATIVIYFFTNFFQTASATFFGAMVVSVIIGIIEHFTHKYLVANGKTEKAYS